MSVTLLEGIPDLSTFFSLHRKNFLSLNWLYRLFRFFFSSSIQCITWFIWYIFDTLPVSESPIILHLKIPAVPDVKNWIRFSLIDFIPGDPLQRLAQVITSKKRSSWSIKDDIQNHRCWTWAGAGGGIGWREEWPGPCRRYKSWIRPAHVNSRILQFFLFLA
jgi:hypothetical protein